MPPPVRGTDDPSAHRRDVSDLRLLLPTLAAWVVTALLLDVDSCYAPLLLGGAALVAAVAPALLFGRRHSRRTGGGAALALVAAVLLTSAAATVCTVLQTADLHRGPLPALARAASVDRAAGGVSGGRTERAVEVELTVTGDPHSHTSRASGSSPGQDLLTVDATADRVTVRSAVPSPAVSPAVAAAALAAPDSFASPVQSPSQPPVKPRVPPPGQPPVPPPVPAGATRTRTPVTVIVRAQDVATWQGLLPSARVGAEVRVLAPSGQSADTGATLLAQGPPRVLAQPSAVQRLAGRLRSGLRQACDQLPADARALLPGLVVGDTSAVPDELDEAFQVTDLVHLTAVSGANLSIVLAVLLGAPGRAGTAERGGLAALLGVPLRVSALLGAALTLAFVTLCRPDPSVLRAAATGLVSLLALATGRPRQAVPALAGAVLALVLADPFLTRSYGFLLSVLATAGLLTLGRRWTVILHERGWPHHLAGAVAAAAAAQALCAPATVLLAPRVSLVGIPCNLLAELAVAPATLLGFAALVASPFSMAAAHLLAGLAGVPTQWLAAVARYGSSVPGAQLAWTPGWPGVVLLAIAIAAAVAGAPLLFRHPPAGPATPGPGTPGPGTPAPVVLSPPTAGPPTAGPPTPGPLTPASTAPDRAASLLQTSAPRPTRRRRLLVPALLVLAVFLLLLRPPPLVRMATGWPPVGWRLVMCSVGQGDLLVLPVQGGGDEAPDTAVVVDTGPDPAAADACLRDLGITRVALLVLTHFHADHSEGLPGVLRGRAVGAIETTTLDAPPGEEARVLGWAAAAHVPLLRATPGEHRSAGPGLSWDVLWPAGPLGFDTPGPNNASVSLLVTAGRLRFALLGDLEPAAQAALLTRARPGPVDVLKVAHHGSANQDWDLATALHPRLALISVGRGNPYGHPAARTLDRLRALGATVLRTDHAGDIAVLGDDPHTLRALVHPHPDTPDDAEARDEPDAPDELPGTVAALLRTRQRGARGGPSTGPGALVRASGGTSVPSAISSCARIGGRRPRDVLGIDQEPSASATRLARRHVADHALAGGAVGSGRSRPRGRPTTAPGPRRSPTQAFDVRSDRYDREDDDRATPAADGGRGHAGGAAGSHAGLRGPEGPGEA
ncbi:ComEC/Rec2 family competence protein [Kitasatospora mediocidica]|uniref:ComEC/Rec2 family competence protein n=1 Tax=Kitasatospora mediocidica TaxID=58352 RepID=UPI000A4D5BFB|nr:ComEC/Rec2 family competence protein [Kitasatospora mediocidica]